MRYPCLSKKYLIALHAVGLQAAPSGAIASWLEVREVDSLPLAMVGVPLAEEEVEVEVGEKVVAGEEVKVGEDRANVVDPLIAHPGPRYAAPQDTARPLINLTEIPTLANVLVEPIVQAGLRPVPSLAIARRIMEEVNLQEDTNLPVVVEQVMEGDSNHKEAMLDLENQQEDLNLPEVEMVGIESLHEEEVGSIQEEVTKQAIHQEEEGNLQEEDQEVVDIREEGNLPEEDQEEAEAQEEVVEVGQEVVVGIQEEEEDNLPEEDQEEGGIHLEVEGNLQEEEDLEEVVGIQQEEKDQEVEV